MHGMPHSRHLLLSLLFLAGLLSVLVTPTPGFAVATQAMPHGDGFDLDCTLCHVVEGWTQLKSPLAFDHGTTRFALEGRHEQVSCDFCHESLEFRQVQSTCSSCHLDVHEGQFGDDCERCHDPEGWINDSRFREMHQETRFALTGPHAGPDCAACHDDGRYAGISTECASCHLDSYYEADTPDHTGYSTECEQCHGLVSTAWPGSVVDFGHTDAFPLVGGHAGPSCQACHPANEPFGVIDSDCYSCHQSDYNRADDPNHVANSFPTDCSGCHTVYDWDDADDFDHGSTGFPLLGEHRDASCNDCHVSGYANTSPECISCHLADYNGAEDHAANGFPTDCTVCHGSFEDWDDGVDENFDHNTRTDFPLTGAHASTDCNLCHSSGVYDGLPDTCFDCHEGDYNGTDDPDHAAEGYPTTCEECHTTSNWEAEEFDHATNTEFELTGAHITTSCGDCHVDGFADTDQACVACHDTEFTEADEPPHEPGSFPDDCTECHNTDAWTPGTFDHDVQTDFIVVGAHIELDCAECHVEAVYDGTPLECFGCHEADYNETDDPDHAGENYPQDCLECHNQDDWEDVDDGDFPHGTVSEFELVGGHAEPTCADCHADGYTVTESACVSCHQADFDATSDPVHQQGAFDSDCAVCHDVIAWAPSGFDHDQQTQFIIDGAHGALDCALCHVDGEYLGTPEVCLGCHQDDFDGAGDPPHQADAFDADCSVCHATSAWTPSSFDHDAQTNFVLDGEHLGEDCTECHTGGDYIGTPETCYGCHQADYEDADDPDHVAEQYPTDCEMCHNTSDWDDAQFSHDNTAFPLTGAHTTTDCALCHTDGYTGTPQACVACHEADFNGAADPPHNDSFDQDCAVCHSTEPGWSPAPGFDHTDMTGVELLGAHGSLDCTLCHVGGVYDGTPTTCISCHDDDYDGTSDPDHGAGSYPQQCTQCHGYDSWADISNFEHNTWTDYQLTGAHTAADCALCHTNGYVGTSEVCIDCHLADGQNAEDPIHTAEFGGDCSVCHTTMGWSPSQFSHQNFTGYPLSGAHVFLNCADCHVDGDYVTTPNQCVGCHQDDYDNAAFDHDAPGFDDQCQDCHGNVGWTPTTYDHGGDTGFDLQGAHASLDCSICHVGGQYDDTPDQCIFCHQDDWNGTSNPNHSAAGFPTECDLCHNFVTWDDADFNHDPWFPIYSGEHQGRWDSCQDCHTTGDYPEFTCTVCHPNNEMDNEHSGIPGYSNNPQACLSCHPDGGDGPYFAPDLMPSEPQQKKVH